MNVAEDGIKDFKTLAGKVVLVTGASRGIGKAIAIAFARQGARLAVCARDLERLNQTVSDIKALGADVYSAAVDVLDEAAISTFLAGLKTNFGKIEVLINNAGIYKTLPVNGHSSAEWQQIINTNLSAPFFFCRETAPEMASAGWGRIINISSISGKHGEIYGSAYSASKAGLIGLTQSLALELASSGVTVNAVCPGWVKTDMAVNQLSDPAYRDLISVTVQGEGSTGQASDSSAPSIEESIEIARLSVPQMRFIEAEEVANLVLYLASEQARGITGQAINICGGMSI